MCPNRRQTGMKMLALAAVSRPGTYGRMRSTTNLVIVVDPTRIQSYVTKFPLRSQYGIGRHPFVLGGVDFPTPIRVWEEDNYVRMADAMRNIDDVTRSIAYRDAVVSLERDGFASYRGTRVHTREDARQVIERYVGELVASFRQNAYDDLLGHPGLAAIGPDGELLKSGRGHHRFTVARELRIARIPLEVHLIHENWATRHGWDAGRRAFSSRERLSAGLEVVARSVNS